MKSFKTTIYANRDKESNWEIVDEFKELFGSECKNLLYIGYEIPIEIEIFEDASCKVLTFCGKDVSNLNIDIS